MSSTTRTIARALATELTFTEIAAVSGGFGSQSSGGVGPPDWGPIPNTYENTVCDTGMSCAIDDTAAYLDA